MTGKRIAPRPSGHSGRGAWDVSVTRTTLPTGAARVEDFRLGRSR